MKLTDVRMVSVYKHNAFPGLNPLQHRTGILGINTGRTSFCSFCPRPLPVFPSPNLVLPGLSPWFFSPPRSLPVVLFSRRFSPIRSFLPALLPGSASTDGVPPGVAFLPDFLPVSAFSPGVPPRFGLFSRRSSPYLPVRNSSISH